jgi:hypothetical protein
MRWFRGRRGLHLTLSEIGSGVLGLVSDMRRA